MIEFNSHQASRLRTTLTYVDELLSEAMGILGPSCGHTPFTQRLADTTPVTHEIIADHATRMRGEMRSFLDAHGIPLPQPRISASHAARAVLMSAQIAVEELAPRYLRGYGELSPEAAAEVAAFIVRLTELLKRMDDYLAQGAGREMASRPVWLEPDSASTSLCRRTCRRRG